MKRILRGGRVVDPANGMDGVFDVSDHHDGLKPAGHHDGLKSESQPGGHS